MLMKSDSATLRLNQFGTEPNKPHRELAFEGFGAMKFKDVYEAGEQLVAVLPLETPDLILAVVPNGVPVAGAVSKAKSVPVRGIEFDRESGAIELKLDRVDQTAEIWVVDDGVESGRAATAIGNRVVYAEMLGQGLGALERGKGPWTAEVEGLAEEIAATLSEA